MDEASRPSVAPDDDPLWARSVRFALTVVTPVLLGFLLDGGRWLPYALLASIGAFGADTGGGPLARLGWMSAMALALGLGGVIGGLVGGSQILLCVSFALAGVIYALTESAHQIALSLSRFFHMSLAIGALYAPIGGEGLIAVARFTLLAWAISIVWDLFAGRWRASTAPTWPAFVAAMKTRAAQRLTFAAALAVTVPLAYMVSLAVGLERPYWTLLALVVVLRVDFMESWRLMADRFLGTALGCAIAGGLAMAAPYYPVLIAALVAAALLRWPAEQRHGLLGVAALTAFVMLMIEIATHPTGHSLRLLEERILDTGLGCVFALVALGLDRALRRMAPVRADIPTRSP